MESWYTLVLCILYMSVYSMGFCYAIYTYIYQLDCYMYSILVLRSLSWNLDIYFDKKTLFHIVYDVMVVQTQIAQAFWKIFCSNFSDKKS